MKFKLMTPERTLLEGEAASVSGRAPGGDFQVLEGHGAWVSALGIGALRVELGEGDRKAFAVHGGVIEVTPGRPREGSSGADLARGSVLVLANLAEAADEIDSDRAEGARARAMERIREQRAGEGGDLARARRALARAAARLRVSAKQR